MEFDYKSPYQLKLDRYTEQYFNKIINTIITNKEFNSLKVLVGWCYGHAIRAVYHHIRSKKFTIEEDDSREILAKICYASMEFSKDKRKY
ncbi:hypothetical protein RhiirB3_456329 [Rhizophagus irregularis]|nr:hypothetical protein RhiirB3_456329 [Rhizophagus irregularis]